MIQRFGLMQCLAGIWTCTTVLFYIILVFWIFVDLSETHVVICGMVSVLKIFWTDQKGGDMHLSSTHMKVSNILMIPIWILCSLSDTEILYYYQFQKNTVFGECRSNEWWGIINHNKLYLRGISYFLLLMSDN